MSHPSALLVVDMQVGLFHGSEKPWQGPRVLAHINLLLDRAHDAGVPVYFARHTGPQGSPIAAGSQLWQLLPELHVDAERDVVFDKTRPSCFLGTDLQQGLLAAGVSELVVAGMKTQYCIDTTCRVAAELGLQVRLVADAHTCMETPALSAQAIIEHHNLTLGGAFARLQLAADVDFACG